MTDEELAEEYTKTITSVNLLNERIYRNIAKQGFLAGLEATKQKWHKVADGDLPKDENRVLLYFGVDDYCDGQFIRGRFWCDSCGWFDVEEVIAWCEIPQYTEE